MELAPQKFIQLDQLLEYHFRTIDKVRRALEKCHSSTAHADDKLELSNCMDEEFSCRSEIIKYNPVCDQERRKRLVHLSGFLIACNCPLNADLNDLGASTRSNETETSNID